MSNKTMFRIFIIAILLALALFVLLAAGSSATELDQVMARTTTISVPSGASIAIYAEAGHNSSEVRWKCAGGKYRVGSDYIRPGCRRITLTARIWFDYAVIRTAQKDA